MAFKLGRRDYHAVKNPVFSLAESNAILGDNEAGILNRRKNAKEKDFDPLIEVSNDAVKASSESISELPSSANNCTSRRDGQKASTNELKPIRRAPNYEEIAKISSNTERSPRYEEIGKIQFGNSPRISNYEELANIKSTSSPSPPNNKSIAKTRTSISPRAPGHEEFNGTKPISPRPSDFDQPKALSPSLVPNPFNNRAALPALVNVPKSKLNVADSAVNNKYRNLNIEKTFQGERNLKDQDQMREAINEARQRNDYEVLTEFLTQMYSSFADVLDVLKVNDNIPSNSAIKINLEYLDFLHESMVRMPKDVRKAILRSIINCMLLKDHRGRKTIDDIRGFLIFLLNPLFTDSSTYVIFAHVLRQVASLENKEQQYLIMWFKKLPLKDFENVISRIRSFISYKLFPTKHDIPEGEKSAWWVPNGIKVLAMLNAANDQSSPPLIPRSKFYVKGIEMLDLIRQYNLWESGSQSFSFCQYPFVLSLPAKRLIMQKDSETKMLLEARQSLVNKFRQKQVPNMGMLFLNLHIRRKHLLEDSLREISKKQGDLKKKLRVTFTGEPGIDLGGVSKEWFFLIIQKFFNEDYGMFTYNSKLHQWWFSVSCKENNQEYNLCGVLLGLAMYNGINLDIRFPLCVYKKLLSPAIVPYNNPHQPVGVSNFGIEDFKTVFPELARGLQELLDYDGDVEEDLCQCFMVSFSEYGQVMNRYLKPDGDKVPVTNENREEYVNLYINYMMNKSIYKQFYSFYHGFHSVCASNALLLLKPEEVETLVIGNPDFNISDLEKITVYDGYSRSDVVIRHLWDAVHDFNTKLKRKFLLFCTGSDRIPIGGMKEMKFKITRITGSNATQMLPIAHTCFNQLCLPPYKSRKLLLKKLSIAIENAEGFGLE